MHPLKIRGCHGTHGTHANAPSVLIGSSVSVINTLPQLHWSRHPYLINTIEMRWLWTEIKCIKSAARVLDRNFVNKRGLDLFKEVLWVSVGQKAAVLQAVKVGGQKKILPISPARAIRVRTGAIGRIFLLPPTLTARKTAALWST